MASLMNGLSALGTGVAGFAATAGLEQQKTDAAQALQTSGGVIQGNLQTQKLAAEADLARQADAMATVRESGGRVQAGQIAATAASTAAGVAAEQARLADVRLTARESTARQQAATLANQALTPEEKLLRALGVPLAGAAAPPPMASTSSPTPSPGAGTLASPTGAASGTAPATDVTAATPTTPGAAKPDPLDNPVVQKALGYPMAGSDDALRRSVAADVKNDLDWKYKTAGQQAVETELRVNVAKGTMTSPATQAANAALIASYQIKPPDGFALTRQGGSETMAKVKELNPDYQESRFGEVNDVMKRFGAQKEGDQVRYLNVGVQHLGVFDQAAAAIGNGDIQALNGLANWFKTNFGVSTPTTLAGLKQIVGTEVERAATGGIGASADRERLMKSLDQANSPAQLQDMTNGFRSLLAGQLKGLKQQYEDGTHFTSGPFAFDNKLDPQTRSIIAGASDATRTPPLSTGPVDDSFGTPSGPAVPSNRPPLASFLKQ